MDIDYVAQLARIDLSAGQKKRGKGFYILAISNEKATPELSRNVANY